MLLEGKNALSCETTQLERVAVFLKMARKDTLAVIFTSFYMDRSTWIISVDSNELNLSSRFHFIDAKCHWSQDAINLNVNIQIAQIRFYGYCKGEHFQ